MIDVNYLENYATDNNKESAEAFIQVNYSREFMKMSEFLIYFFGACSRNDEGDLFKKYLDSSAVRFGNQK